MADTNWTEINDGYFALALVDTDADGYSDDWLAPSGLTAETVTLETYGMPDGSSWRCQVTSGALNPTSSTKTRDRRASFCNTASKTVTPVASSWKLDIEVAQDPDDKDGLQRFLFEHDAEEAYFMLGLNGGQPPTAIGRVYLAASAFGGKPDEDLVATLSMLLPRKPSIDFGTAAEHEVVS